MKRTRKISNYFLYLILKLLALGIAMMGLIIVTLFSINNSFKHSLPWWSSFVIAFLPFLCFLFFFFIKILDTGYSDYLDKLAHFKYNPYIPYFYYYLEPKKNKKIDLNEIQSNIQNCDIVLRRYKRYLDGIIFSQNSYFTHVGIYYKDKDEHKVLHSLGSKGVHESKLEDFCKCDDIAILRFSLGDVKEEEDIREYINGQKQKINESTDLIKKELSLFEELISKTKLKDNNLNEADIFTERYRDIVLSRALSLKGVKYDFYFNFNNFDTLSCIEYVWYCFKCLFPFHRIRVKDFEFFNWIKMPIIIPDVFVKNDFFKYIWASVPNVENKKQLKKIIKKGRKQFWFFLLSIYLWNIIVLVMYYFFKTHNYDGLVIFRAAHVSVSKH